MKIEEIMHDFRKLNVWKDSVDLCSDLYKLHPLLPHNLKLSLWDQLFRSAISIPSNIAEGAGRGSQKGFTQFLKIAIGSSYELETQLIILNNLNLIDSKILNELVEKTQYLQRRIYSLINSINQKER